MKNQTKEQLSTISMGFEIADAAIEMLESGHVKYDTALDEYMATNPHSVNLSETLTDASRMSDVLAAYDRQERFASVKSLETKLKQRKFEKRRRTMLRYSAVSAAALLLISFYLFYPQSSSQSITQSLAVQQEIVVPTLVLGDGDNLNLNESSDRILEIEKVGDKKISYTNHNRSINDKIAYNTIVIPSKYTYSVVLADSTEVFLNANSELKYPTRFVGDKREVYLKGEALFKVKKGNKPFIVKTEEIKVKVYGTVFNVNTNKRSRVETVLVNGSVSVTPTDGSSKEKKISPNQMFVLNTENGTKQVENVNPDLYVGWMSNKFKCENQKLYMLLDEIALWYGVHFDYNNKIVNDLLVDISLSRDTEIENILRVIENISGVIINKKSDKKYVVE